MQQIIYKKNKANFTVYREIYQFQYFEKHGHSSSGCYRKETDHKVTVIITYFPVEISRGFWISSRHLVAFLPGTGTRKDIHRNKSLDAPVVWHDDSRFGISL